MSDNLKRVNVNLVGEGSRIISDVAERHDINQTDAVAKGLELLDLYLTVKRGGGALYVRETSGAELERLRFL